MFGFGRAKARPNARDVVTRAVILQRVLVHALATPTRDVLVKLVSAWTPAERDEFELDAERMRDKAWSEVAPLHARMSPWERDFLRSTVIDMTPEQHTNASWRIEALQVMAWALGLCPSLPPYDVQADYDLLKLFSSLEIKAYLASIALRPADEIERERDNVELWHWRSRTRQLIEEGQPFPVPMGW